jgi:hypothetical protein
LSSKTNVFVSAAVAAIVAVALVAAVLYTGFLVFPAREGTSGTLSVLLTDPPVLPAGATALYMTYSDMQVHVSDDSNSSGWLNLGASGSINLTSVVNVTETVASSKVQSGSFNALRFQISSATLTYHGSNYSVDVADSHNVLYVPILGGIQIVNGESAATVVDVMPTVLLLGSEQSPTFELLPVAKAFALPTQSIPSLHTGVGDRDDISENQFLKALLGNSRFDITAVSLTPTFLSVTVLNTGNDALVFRLVALSPLSSTTSQTNINVAMYGSLPAPTTGAFFAVEADGSLVALTSGNRAQVYTTLEQSGYFLPQKATVTFTYSGQISLGAIAQQTIPGFNAQQIVPEEGYFVRVSASDSAAGTAVTAQPPS